jgi:multidrug efflux system membrane fusion protein
MRRGIISGTVIAVLLAGGTAATYPYLSSGSRPPVASPVAAVPVTTQMVKSGDVPIYLSGIGTVEAYNTVVVRTQIQGQITQIGFIEGQAVKDGDLLAQIDPRPYQAQLDQAVANRARDEALLVNAQANLQRYLPLLAKQFATPQLVDTQKAQVARL